MCLNRLNLQFKVELKAQINLSNLLNQINLIMYTAKFAVFLFDQISLIKFWKNRTFSI